MKEKGILLHISSLPSPYGIGSLGKCAYDFVDFLKETNQNYWQVLPLGPTSYGDSPYQSFSSFAGNPYFIDLDILGDKGLLTKEEIEKETVDKEYVDYYYLYQTRNKILRKAFSRFQKSKEYYDFLDRNKEWLDDYALFMTLKTKYPEGSFLSFPKEYQNRYSDEITYFIKNNEQELDYWRFLQFEFFIEWKNLKEYANNLGIKIIGDMPIYVAYDSSDVYSNPSLFKLNKNLVVKKIAGVPPDYFSKTGQLWGNPVYRYDVMKKDHYKWWISRLRKGFELYDVIRIDHFRGFASFYQVGRNEKTAINGMWVKGPGYSLFKEMSKELGTLDIIAEDLGFITPDVVELLNKTGFPGMKVLEFAFDGNKDNPHLPENYIENSVCYTGTHDNPPLKEWLESLSKKDIHKICDYLKINEEEDINYIIDKFISLALSTKSNRVIIPLQDYLHMGKEARFNHPSVLGGNWVWRLSTSYNSKEVIDKINSFKER